MTCGLDVLRPMPKPKTQMPQSGERAPVNSSVGSLYAWELRLGFGLSPLRFLVLAVCKVSQPILIQNYFDSARNSAAIAKPREQSGNQNTNCEVKKWTSWYFFLAFFSLSICIRRRSVWTLKFIFNLLRVIDFSFISGVGVALLYCTNWQN